jgi:hypothetical protein
VIFHRLPFDCKPAPSAPIPLAGFFYWQSSPM